MSNHEEEPPLSQSSCISILKDYDLSIDYYSLLNVNIDDDQSAIRKGYRSMSLILHPDKNPDNPDAQNQFQLLRKAFDLLSNPEMKLAYDTVLQFRKSQVERVHQLSSAKRKLRKELEEREREDETKRARASSNEIAKLNRSAKITQLRHMNQSQLRMWTSELAHRSNLTSSLSAHQVSSNIPPEHRTIKLIGSSTEYPTGMDEKVLRNRLETSFGPVDDLLVDNRTAIVQFTHLLHAVSLLDAFKYQVPLFMSTFDQIVWASGNPPPLHFLTNLNAASALNKFPLSKESVEYLDKYVNLPGFSLSVDPLIFDREEEILSRLNALD